MPGLKHSRSARAPGLLLALGVSAAIHWGLLGAVVLPAAPEQPAWGRLDVSLVAPGAPAGRLEASAAAAAPALRGERLQLPAKPPAAIASAGPAPPAFGATASVAPPALPIASRGGSLVLPTAVRATYAASGRGERELVWRLAGGRYRMRWTLDEAALSESARGSLSWSGLLPLQYSRRAGGLEQSADFDWARLRSTGLVEASLDATTLDPASLAMQIAVAHQWLDQAARRAGWVVQVLGRGRVWVHEIDAGAAGPVYQLEWPDPATDDEARLVELELAPEHGFLPKRLRERQRAGELVWRLAAVENLPVE